MLPLPPRVQPYGRAATALLSTLGLPTPAVPAIVTGGTFVGHLAHYQFRLRASLGIGQPARVRGCARPERAGALRPPVSSPASRPNNTQADSRLLAGCRQFNNLGPGAAWGGQRPLGAPRSRPRSSSTPPVRQPTSPRAGDPKGPGAGNPELPGPLHTRLELRMRHKPLNPIDHERGPKSSAGDMGRGEGLRHRAPSLHHARPARLERAGVDAHLVSTLHLDHSGMVEPAGEEPHQYSSKARYARQAPSPRQGGAP